MVTGSAVEYWFCQKFSRRAAVYLIPVQPGNQGRGWWTLLLQKQSTTQQIKNGVWFPENPKPTVGSFFFALTCHYEMTVEITL